MKFNQLLDLLKGELKGSPLLNWSVAKYLGHIPEHRIIKQGWDYNWWREAEDRYSLRRAIDSSGRTIETWQPCPYTTDLGFMHNYLVEMLSNFSPYKDFYINTKLSLWGAEVAIGKSIGMSRIWTPHNDLTIALCISMLKWKENFDNGCESE